MVYVISQIMGLFAIIFWTYSIQNRDKRDVLRFQIYSSLFYAISFFLLKGYSAFIVDVISIARLYVFYKEEEKYGQIDIFWLVFFILLGLSFGMITYDGFYSLIPVVIGTFYVISTYVKSTKVLRVFYIICAFFWLIYNIKYYAFTAVIGNIIEIISGFISMFRFERKDYGSNRKVKKNN